MVTPFVPPTDQEVLDAWRQGRLGDVISNALDALVGEGLADLGRASDLLWMGFGEEVSAPGIKDPDRRMARHRLHVQCPWRLDGPDGPVLASRDMYSDPSGPSKTAEDFQWNRPGANLFDFAVEAFSKEHPAGSLVVESVVGDRAGGLDITLSRGFAWRMFPADSWACEHWRYFRAGEDGPHLVVLPEE
jgi:hypothetical protein